MKILNISTLKFIYGGVHSSSPGTPPRAQAIELSDAKQCKYSQKQV